MTSGVRFLRAEKVLSLISLDGSGRGFRVGGVSGGGGGGVEENAKKSAVVGRTTRTPISSSNRPRPLIAGPDTLLSLFTIIPRDRPTGKGKAVASFREPPWRGERLLQRCRPAPAVAFPRKAKAAASEGLVSGTAMRQDSRGPKRSLESRRARPLGWGPFSSLTTAAAPGESADRSGPCPHGAFSGGSRQARRPAPAAPPRGASGLADGHRIPCRRWDEKHTPALRRPVTRLADARHGAFALLARLSEVPAATQCQPGKRREAPLCLAEV